MASDQSNFVILHLSDAHIGKGTPQIDENKVLESLYVDLAKMKNELGPPNLVIFTGDLVQGCGSPCPTKNCSDCDENCILEKQYAKAKDFIEKVFESCGIKLNEIPLLIVPGNHDVNRNVIDLNVEKARDSYDKTFIKKLQKNETSWESNINSQKRWSKFIEDLGKPNYVKRDKKFNVPYGILEHSGKKIGFTGLNTSWASCNEKDKCNLWVGTHQFDTVNGYLQKCDFKIIASHHPLNWLNTAEETELGRKIETNFQLYFHGHEHSRWFLDSTGHLKVEAGACYESSEKPLAYSWLSLNLTETCGNIFLRKYSDETTANWMPANVPKKTDAKGKAAIKSLFLGDTQVSLETSNETCIIQDDTRLPIRPFPNDLKTLIEQLEENFKIRWEPGTAELSTNNVEIFWPVKLRELTAIHAAQCFIVAGLIKIGCKVNLFIDDLGHNEHNSIEKFVDDIKQWIKKVGVDCTEQNFQCTRYHEINNERQAEKAQIFETLLVNHIYKTDTLLRIAKICNTEIYGSMGNEDAAQDIISKLTSKRPCRLLTPAMTWTCLKKMQDDKPSINIITLGGRDESILWKTWRDCISNNGGVGHIYMPELTGINMSVLDFKWASKDDIRDSFGDNADSDDNQNSEEFINKMIPWSMINCSLIPAFIAEENGVEIDGETIYSCADLERLYPDNRNNLHGNANFVNAVARWVL